MDFQEQAKNSGCLPGLATEAGRAVRDEGTLGRPSTSLSPAPLLSAGEFLLDHDSLAM